MSFAPSVPNLNALLDSYNILASSIVYNFLQNDTENNWNIMDANSKMWLKNNTFNVDGLRVVNTLSDGTVCYDSFSKTNSYENYKSKSINENHNTRVAILQALLSNSGVGYDNRNSTTTGKFAHYIAQRISVTPYTSSAGCVRVSMNRPPN
jgi:hypothetical protein